jgi:hypothetical protein
MLKRAPPTLRAKADQIRAICRRSANPYFVAWADAPVENGRNVRALVMAGEDKIDRLEFLVQSGLDAQLPNNIMPGSVLRFSHSEFSERVERVAAGGADKFQNWFRAKRGLPA